jgi:hypothetical protein
MVMLMRLLNVRREQRRRRRRRLDDVLRHLLRLRDDVEQ